MTFEELFPTAYHKGTKKSKEVYHISFEGQEWEIPKEDVTEREQVLLSSFLKDSSNELDDPWKLFLSGEEDQPPKMIKSFQMLYLDHSNVIHGELRELLGMLLNQELEIISFDERRTGLLLFEPQEDVLQTLHGVLPTIENDFDIRLSVLLGNSWKLENVDTIRQVILAENDLFSAYLSDCHHLEKVQNFPRIVLWGLSNHKDLDIVKEVLKTLMEKQEDLPDLVNALWVSHGNQVQAAQYLFLHRNTLQYRLEKWHQLSGLQIKHLDDLALCYCLLLEE